MDTIMTDTIATSIDELVKAGREVIRQHEADEAARKQKDAAAKKQLEADVIERVKALLPEPLREFIHFHRWRDSLASDDRWNAEVDICAPGLAPVRIKLYADCYFSDQEDKEGLRDVMLYNRRGYVPYAVLSFRADPGDDEAFVRTRMESEHEDLLAALADAAEIGETYLAAQAEVDRLNRAEKPAAALPPAVTVVMRYDAWRDTLKTAQGFIDRGLASTAQEYSWLVMASALVDIAETLKGMTDDDGDLRIYDTTAGGV